MDLIVLILKVLGGFALVMLVIAGPWLLLEWLFYVRAKRVIRAYCQARGLTMIRTVIHRNHYGLYFLHEDRKWYARFRVRKGQVQWTGKLPAFLGAPARS